jgi:hypothetical protein
MALGLNPKFQALIERARAEHLAGDSLLAEGARRLLADPE